MTAGHGQRAVVISRACAGTRDAMGVGMHHRVASLLCFASACVVTSTDADPPPAARILAAWDPLACRDTYQRVVVELEDEDGVELSSSAACRVGRLTLDAPSWGVYRGRIYTWVLGEAIRSVTQVMLTVDASIVHWQLPTPP